MGETAESERWLALAKDALLAYDMAEAQVEWLAHTHNAVFDVQCEGQRYVLRMCHHADNRWDNLYGELLCLAEIRKSSRLGVPKVVEIDSPPEEIIKRSAHRWHYMSGITTQGAAEPGEQIHGILFHYIEGEHRSPAHLTSLDMKRVGKFLAQLHDITAKADVAKADSIRRAGTFRPRLDYEGLFGRNSRYYPGEAAALFTPEQQQTMAEAQAKVRTAMDEIGTEITNFGLIHGDMLLPNILFHEGEVRALDFEYCGMGYYLYDLAPLLWHLKPEARYSALEDALWEGYTSVRPLPRRELLETFIGGRHVASMLWTAINQHHPFIAGKAREILQQRCDELRAYLDTGTLHRTPI